MSTAYINQLNEFSRKFILKGGYTPTQEDAMLYKNRIDDIKSSIFESLLLFDKTCFKVVGENIPLAILVTELGVRGLEKLIDQNGLTFLHWQTMIGSMVDNIPGVLPLISGKYSDGPYVDPEESIISGLKFLIKQPNKNERNTILKKVRDLYENAAPTDPTETTHFVTSAFESGKLKQYGLDNNAINLYSLPASQKRDLAICAEDLLEYKYVLSKNITNIQNSRFNSLFSSTASNITRLNPSSATSVVAKLEDFPDLKAAYIHIESPFQKAISMRQNKNIVKFRKWVDTAPKNNQSEISRAYLDAISDPGGFFKTKAGKLTKIMTMTIIGAVATAGAGPITVAAGMAAGATVAALVDPALGAGIDIVDEFLLSGLTKGWSPRMFFKEIEKMGIRIEPTLNAESY